MYQENFDSPDKVNTSVGRRKATDFWKEKGRTAEGYYPYGKLGVLFLLVSAYIQRGYLPIWKITPPAKLLADFSAGKSRNNEKNTGRFSSGNLREGASAIPKNNFLSTINNINETPNPGEGPMAEPVARSLFVTPWGSWFFDRLGPIARKPNPARSMNKERR